VPARGGEYTEALVGSPIYINPLLDQTNDVDQDLSKLVFSSLLKYDGHRQLVNDLTESYMVSDDQKTYTFKIKQNARWHDDKPLTADDIIFTIKTIQDPQYKSPLLLSLQGVAAVKLDDYAVRLDLKKPFAPFPSILTFGILPEHIWANVPPANFGLAELNVKPVGSGAWQFQSLTKDKQGTIRSMTLASFVNFYVGGPILYKLTFNFYPTSQEALIATVNKEVVGVSFVPKKSLGDLPKNLNAISLGLPQYTALFFNQKNNPLLKDLDLRKALAYSINKTELVTQAINDEGDAVNSPILPGFIGYKADLEGFAFDADKASKILDSAGWKQISETDYIDYVKAAREKSRADAEATAQAAAKATSAAEKKAAKVSGQVSLPMTTLPATTGPTGPQATAGSVPATGSMPTAAQTDTTPAEESIETFGQTIFRRN
ncbi:MAG: ABC transporter substrate-binding protein, partial [Bacteroidota bacterium]